MLLKYPANLANDNVISGIIIGDEYVFATYFSAMMQGLASGVHNPFDAINEIVKNQIDSYEPEDTHTIDLDMAKQERMMKIVDGLRAQFNEQVTTTYVRDFFYSITIFRAINNLKNYQDSLTAFRAIIEDINTISVNQIQGVSVLSLNIERIKTLLNLDTAEARLLELNLYLSTDVRCMIFRDFLFSVMKNPSMYDYVYKTMIGEDLSDNDKTFVDAALSERSVPITIGIVSYDRKTKKMSLMSEFWVFTLSHYAESDAAFFKRFVEPMTEKKRSFSGAIAKIQAQEDEGFVKEFLERIAQVKNDEYPSDGAFDKRAVVSTGHNLLFYGAKNLDKIGYVFNMLKSASMDGYQVRVRDAKASDIPAICVVAQKYLHTINDGNMVLVIDKAEQALSKQRSKPSWYIDMFGNDGVDAPQEDELDSDEALLINNPVPTIWLTNSVSGITPENVGRFLLHIELRGGSRKDRREEVQVICDELGFSSEIAQQLSMYYELNAEQVKSAARTTTFMERVGNEGEKTLVHLIGNSQKALDREKTEQLRASVTHYDLDLLNLSGTLNPGRIIEALKKNPIATLCFYGLPGTGKTALAEHIAMKLDMPITIKPASELLSMWLGESEKNIAKMFEEAKAEGSILLLDEADSFLRDRSTAQRSWEVTQVNELLQRMERFPGIFICTTNLFQAIDAAALRRFTFKLEFLALTAQQRVKMLAAEAEVDLSTLSDAERSDLEIDCQLIRYLTPGDFATVKRQANLFGEKLSLHEWMRRLEIESKAKLVGIERNEYGNEFRGGEVTTKKRGE